MHRDRRRLHVLAAVPLATSLWVGVETLDRAHTGAALPWFLFSLMCLTVLTASLGLSRWAKRRNPDGPGGRHSASPNKDPVVIRRLEHLMTESSGHDDAPKG
jgi:hypothetical protein